MRKTFDRCSRLALLAIPLLLGACAPPPEAARQRYFWPPAQLAAPRIEYINFYQGKQDARRGEDSWLEKAVLGEEVPQRLFARPFAIASDGRDRVYVSDIGLNRVFVFDFGRKEVRTLKSRDNRSEDFLVSQALGLAIDADGNIYVCDTIKKEIHRFGPDESYRGVVVSRGLERPIGIAVDSARGLLYVADAGSHQVKVFDAAGEAVRTIGRHGSGDAEFNFPLDVALDGEGNAYVLDSMNARVKVFSPQGEFLRAFGERGTASGSFQLPKSIAVSPFGQVYVTDSQAHRFVIFDLQGEFLLPVGGRFAMVDTSVVPGGMYLPEGIDVDSQGRVWVVDSLNRLFHQFQYLTPEYLAEHPILPGQAAEPTFPEGDEE